MTGTIEKAEKIDKELFDKAVKGDILKKDCSALEEKIGKRFYYIAEFLSSFEGGRLEWIDYTSGYGEHDGDFDFSSYEEYIPYEGAFEFPDPYNWFGEFPTCWLWEDFEDEVIENINKEKEKKKEKNRKQEERREYLKDLAEKMKKKLSKDEIAAVKQFL